jgi:hypothetical protein
MIRKHLEWNSRCKQVQLVEPAADVGGQQIVGPHAAIRSIGIRMFARAVGLLIPRLLRRPPVRLPRAVRERKFQST